MGSRQTGACFEARCYMNNTLEVQKCRRAVIAMRLAMKAMTRADSAAGGGAPDTVLLGEYALAQLKRAETLRLLAE